MEELIKRYDALKAEAESLKGPAGLGYNTKESAAANDRLDEIADEVEALDALADSAFGVDLELAWLDVKYADGWD